MRISTQLIVADYESHEHEALYRVYTLTHITHIIYNVSYITLNVVVTFAAIANGGTQRGNPTKSHEGSKCGCLKSFKNDTSHLGL